MIGGISPLTTHPSRLDSGRLLGQSLTLRNLGRQTVKGIAEPVEAWVVEGVSSAESRFESTHTGRLTGFVGREREVELIDQRRRLAWSGEGQIVLISGEAGIGKSRFAAWFGERLAEETHTRLRPARSRRPASAAR